MEHLPYAAFLVVPFVGWALILNLRARGRPPPAKSIQAAGEAEEERHLLIIYALVVLYAACYQMQSPVEPFLVEKLVKANADNSTSGETWEKAYGRLSSFFSFWQFVGSLVFGLLLDRVGVRAVFIINFLAAATGYYLLSITDSITFLYLAKIPGVALCGFLCAQTAVVKLTAEGPSRLKALGRLTTSYTVGGVIGPYAGGLLSRDGDLFISAKVAAAGSLLAALLVLLLPRTVDGGSEGKKAAQKAQEDGGASTGSTAARVLGVLQLVWLLLFARIVSSVANSMSRSAQPIILKNDLGCDVAMLGLVKSLQMGFGGFANGFLLAPIKSLLGGEGSEGKVVPRTLTIVAALFVAQAALFSPTLGLFADAENRSLAGTVYIGLALLKSCFTFTLMNFVAAQISASVPRDLQGTLMGLQHALFAVAHVAGPTIGVHMLTGYGITGLTGSCACFYAIVLAVWTVASGSLPAVQAKEHDG